MLKEYTSTITLVFGGNNYEAESREDYIEKVIEGFYEQTGIKIDDSEISNIEELSIEK